MTHLEPWDSPVSDHDCESAAQQAEQARDYALFEQDVRDALTRARTLGVPLADLITLARAAGVSTEFTQ